MSRDFRPPRTLGIPYVCNEAMERLVAMTDCGKMSYDDRIAFVHHANLFEIDLEHAWEDPQRRETVKRQCIDELAAIEAVPIHYFVDCPTSMSVGAP